MTVPDAPTPATSLTILGEDAFGLAFAQHAHLAVQVSGDHGALAGQFVTFGIVANASGESAGGSSLSAASVQSGADGQAGVDLVAGAARAHFRVVASTPFATPVTFFATVSDQGFADLTVRPVHVGPRASQSLGTVVVRLYAAGTGCAALAPESAPAGAYPDRSVEPGGTATFPSLAASDGYSLLAWTSSTSGTTSLVTADACVDITPGQLRASSAPSLDLPLADRPFTLAASYQLTSTIDFLALDAKLLGAGSAWAKLACPHGAAQLVLDCLEDLLDGGDAVDCEVTAPGALAQAFETARGPVDASGCRAANPVDDAVEAVLVADSTTRVDDLPAAAGGLEDLLDSISLTATLFPAGSAGVLALGSLGLEASGGRFQVSLTTTARPLVTVPVVVALDDDVLEIGPAPITLRLGPIVFAAFAQVTPFSSGTDVATRLLSSTLCTAISQSACTAVAAAKDCLVQTCTAAKPVLGGLLEAPFDALTTSDVDFILDGSALGDDTNGDLAIDRLSSGLWRVTAELATGDDLELSGSFDGQ